MKTKASKGARAHWNKEKPMLATKSALPLCQNQKQNQ